MKLDSIEYQSFIIHRTKINKKMENISKHLMLSPLN